uniref:ABC transporter permease n=1 Tax=Rhodymenia pseudopalmata TaxID=31502 RepID=A0A1C9C7N1_RHOPU|nr:hypothetical protein Rhodyp_103 [Rhodymenia pseudopalmata]AOM64381.1 hypothetical protein Rhodyp_103 [Rhodymenia pseudopalmata]
MNFVSFEKLLRIDIQMSKQEFLNTLEQFVIIGPGSLSIALTTAFFVGLVFSLQVIKEFLYLDAASLIGAVLTLAFIRELSPVLTSVIVIGRVCSSFTAELATMAVTDQLDTLYLLQASPFFYLVVPRVIACLIVLPALNVLCLITSLASSSFMCFILYNIDPAIFFASAFSALYFLDIIKSIVKTIIFAVIMSAMSCFLGLTATGGAKGVGRSTTLSVVACLLAIFLADFILSYFMFNRLGSSIQVL